MTPQRIAFAVILSVYSVIAIVALLYVKPISAVASRGAATVDWGQPAIVRRDVETNIETPQERCREFYDQSTNRVLFDGWAAECSRYE